MIKRLLNSDRNLVTCVINKLKSKEAYLEGDGHMVLRVSWGPKEGAGSHAAGFRVPGAVGEGANNLRKILKSNTFLNYYKHINIIILHSNFGRNLPQ